MIDPHFTDEELSEENTHATLTDLPEINEWDEDDFDDISDFGRNSFFDE